MSALSRPFVALTIAGSDSGGGAGIQADLKTFAAHGVYGTSAVTAVTAQNTVSVVGVEEIPPELVGMQIDAVATDIGVDAAKTGMLASSRIIRIVARKLEEHGIERVVVDPVMVSKSGARLLAPDAIEALARELLPRALVITPNLPEAEALVGFPLGDDAARRRAAERLVGMGASAALIKGGHAEGVESVDLLFTGKAGGVFREYRAKRVRTRSTHGTGCTFSAAITAGLARGESLEAAIETAKYYVTAALAAATPLGQGFGPLEHFVGCTVRSKDPG
jgi:hydroxymethylpyrimidine/phosphomethylpyrimidine kinase